VSKDRLNGQREAARTSSSVRLVMRALLIVAIAVAGFVVAGAALAGPPSKPPSTTTTTTTTSSSGASGTSGTSTAFMRRSLAEAIKANPARIFDVIVKGKKGANPTAVASEVASVQSAVPATTKGVTKKYTKALNAVVAQLTGKQISALATRSKIAAITLDSNVAFTEFSNSQLWPVAADADSLWASTASAPAIAIIDTGVDATRAADFGARVVAEEKLTLGRNNSPGDGRGHGTFVASIAAGGAAGYAGAAPGANIVSLDVMDDSGIGRMSDVVSAVDWILQNRTKYNIRVANLSLHGAETSSFMYDPVNQAVQKLWLSGVVVVAASGNYGKGSSPSGVLYSPGNDPFIITVGASDYGKSAQTRSDDFNAPWSAWGYTLDGFAKPELGAPGRYLNGAVPVTASMYLEHVDRIVAPGYMWMSGTSFAAPVVAGIAAQILAAHPSFTPDQVKGALMLAAAPAGSADSNSLGVGVVRGAAAVAIADPPNPNLALNRYVVSDPDTGGLMFDAASWTSAAKADASWTSASWTSASWTSASWSSASWSSASWTSASWTSASWTSGQTIDGTLPAASWTSLTWLS
jgi:serine protease AprX